MTVRVGVVGTSWWSDAMYLPALREHPDAEVVAVCGRNPQRTRSFVDAWAIPQAFTDYAEMLDAGLDAVIIASSNATHYVYTAQALERGLHVLCEKPLTRTVAEAEELLKLAKAKGVKHMVPFTYRFMPTNRYLKRLIDDGYLGQPYHMDLRYYTGYARDGAYHWRFDLGESGSGVLGDLGSHWLYLARWFYGEVTALTCRFGHHVPRGSRPDGKPYTQTEDSATLLLEFANGAQANLFVSAACFENSPFGQTHQMSFHGSDGTLHSTVDWDKVQEVRGARAGEGMPQPLTIPDDIWEGVRRDTVHNTYRDVFRQEDHMARGFITAILEDKPASPDFGDGLAVQKLMAAAQRSAASGCRVELDQKLSAKLL